MTKKRLYTRKLAHAKQIIDFYLQPNNIKALNSYEKRRFKEFKNIFNNIQQEDANFMKQAKSLERFLGLNKTGISDFRKKVGTLRTDKDKHLYLSITSFSPKVSTIEYQDKDIVDILLEYEKFKRAAQDFNVLSYLSSFTGDFYNDWVDRFARHVGMGGMNDVSVKQWTELILTKYEGIISDFGRSLVEETLIKLRENNYHEKNKSDVERVLLSFLGKK